MSDFFTWLAEFMSTGIYDLITAAFASFIEWLVLMKLQWMLWLLKFSWGVAQTLITSLGISTALQQAWGSLDSQVMAELMFFKVPEAINLILGAFGTRFVMRFIPVGL